MATYTDEELRRRNAHYATPEELARRRAIPAAAAGGVTIPAAPPQTPPPAMPALPAPGIEGAAWLDGMGLGPTGPTGPTRQTTSPGAEGASWLGGMGLGPTSDPRLPTPDLQSPPPAPAMPPRLFVDSDGVARAGYNMGASSGLVPASPAGVPEGLDMQRVPTASGQGSAFVGRPIGTDLPTAPDAGPAARMPGANVSAANLSMPALPPGPDGMVWDPSTNQFESSSSRAQREEADATRHLRFGQSGPTSAINRRVAADQDARRNESTAMRALRAGTAADIAKAQGAPAIGGGPAGTMAWNPKTGRYEQMGKQEVASGAGGTVAIDAAGRVSTTAPVAQPVDMTEQIKNMAGAIKALSGNHVDPTALLMIGNNQDPAERAKQLAAITKGNPELTKLLSDHMTRLLGGQGGAVGGGQGAGTAAPAPGSLFDRSNRSRR